MSAAIVPPSNGIKRDDVMMLRKGEGVLLLCIMFCDANERDQALVL